MSTHEFHYLLAERGEVLHSSVIVCRSKLLLMAASPSRSRTPPPASRGGQTRACRHPGRLISPTERKEVGLRGGEGRVELLGSDGDTGDISGGPGGLGAGRGGP